MILSGDHQDHGEHEDHEERRKRSLREDEGGTIFLTYRINEATS